MIQVTVTANVFNTANVARNVEALITIKDGSGNTVGTPTDVPVSLVTGNGDLTLNLGQISTTGLSNGLYGVLVSLVASDGTPVPGRSSQADFEIGQPVTATVVASPSILPPGTSTVTTTIQTQRNATNATTTPLITYNNAFDFSLSGNPNGAWSYGYLAAHHPTRRTFTRYTSTANANGLEEWSSPTLPVSQLAVFDNPTKSVLDYGTGVLQPGEAGFTRDPMASTASTALPSQRPAHTRSTPSSQGSTIPA